MVEDFCEVMEWNCILPTFGHSSIGCIGHLYRAVGHGGKTGGGNSNGHQSSTRE